MQTQTWNAVILSNSPKTVYKNFATGLWEIWQFEGLRGLYRGFGPTALGSMPASCLFFTTYEVAKSELHLLSSGDAKVAKNQSSAFFVHVASGLIAEIISCTLWVPIDVIKERMQIQSVPLHAHRSRR